MRTLLKFIAHVANVTKDIEFHAAEIMIEV